LGQLRIPEVATARVEVHHLGERGLAAVVEVRGRERNVAEPRRLEGTAVRPRAAAREGDAIGAEPRPTEVLRGGPHADVVKALVPSVLVARALAPEEAEGGVRHLGPCMALGAVALAVEDAEAALLAIGERTVVAGEVPVEGRVRRHQRRLVGLDGLAPDAG